MRRPKIRRGRGGLWRQWESESTCGFNAVTGDGGDDGVVTTGWCWGGGSTEGAVSSFLGGMAETRRRTSPSAAPARGALR